MWSLQGLFWFWERDRNWARPTFQERKTMQVFDLQNSFAVFFFFLFYWETKQKEKKNVFYRVNLLALRFYWSLLHSRSKKKTFLREALLETCAHSLARSIDRNKIKANEREKKNPSFPPSRCPHDLIQKWWNQRRKTLIKNALFCAKRKHEEIWVLH